MAALIIRRFGTGEEVHRVELRRIHKHHVGRVMSGLMRNMNLDEFYVDDSEVEEKRAKENRKLQD